jgi:hypothetical protein
VFACGNLPVDAHAHIARAEERVSLR